MSKSHTLQTLPAISWRVILFQIIPLACGRQSGWPFEAPEIVSVNQAIEFSEIEILS
jgi:hypothetical protein